MITINISLIPLLIAVVLFVGGQLAMKHPFMTKLILKWKQRSYMATQLTQAQQTYKNFSCLAQFIDWLEKQMPNRGQRKQFWRRFIDEKSYRNMIVEKFIKQLEMSAKVTPGKKKASPIVKGRGEKPVTPKPEIPPQKPKAPDIRIMKEGSNKPETKNEQK